MEAQKKIEQAAKFFTARLPSIPTDVPLRFDLYLWINNRTVLFKKAGEVLTSGRVRRLLQDGLKEFLIPEEQRHLYMHMLVSQIKNPDTKTDIKARFIKESAYVHVNDLFTKADVKEAIHESKQLVQEMVTFISEDIDAATSLMRLSHHDYYTYNHSVNVAVYSIALARKIFDDNKLVLLAAGFGGLLHDIGKRRVDLSIINKSGPLNEEEWVAMKKHPTYGIEYLESYNHVPSESKDIVHEHHENFDGTGYPNGIKEEQISLLSRITTIADVFDALTTSRAYRGALTPTEALQTMYSMQPGKFDPSIFQVFDKDFPRKSPMEFDKDFDPCQPQLILRPNTKKKK